MNYETMVDLARQAVHDKDARLIFQDAIKELGLETVLRPVAMDLVNHASWPEHPSCFGQYSYERRAFVGYSAWYAAALFAGWQSEPWQLAKECQLPGVAR